MNRNHDISVSYFQQDIMCYLVYKRTKRIKRVTECMQYCFVNNIKQQQSGNRDGKTKLFFLAFVSN